MHRKTHSYDISGTLLSSEQYESHELEVFTWGRGEYFCLFHDSKEDEPIPRKIECSDPIFDVSTFKMIRNRCCIVYDYEGRIYSFGYGGSGMLGHGDDSVKQESPKLIESLAKERIIEVCGSFMGFQHTLFLNFRKKVFGCGSNRFWQAIGRKNEVFVDASEDENVLRPLPVLLAHPVCSIACGDCFSMAVVDLRTKILSFGHNGYGALGNGTLYNDERVGAPQEVVGAITDWRVDSLCMGSNHCMALTSGKDGKCPSRLWIWGANSYFQHGSGEDDTDDHPVAASVSFFEVNSIAIAKISCGMVHNAVISSGGNLFMWGGNSAGLCAVDATMANDMGSCVSVPVKVSFSPNEQRGESYRCLDIFCSKWNSFAICEHESERHTRRVCFSWGRTDFGQLGHGEDVIPVGEDDVILRPKEIAFFGRYEEDFTVREFGGNGESSFCVVEKPFFHLKDPILQDDKLELCKLLDIIL